MSAPTSLTLTRPDDWHLHVRDGAALAAVVPHTARQFGRAIIMPNLRPPVTTAQQALEYKQRILAAVPQGVAFEPLDAPGALWAGTMPGGLFRSEDRGQSWRLIEPLWHHPTRVKWNGGGADHAALHSICVDPRDPRSVVVAAGRCHSHDSRESKMPWVGY